MTDCYGRWTFSCIVFFSFFFFFTLKRKNWQEMLFCNVPKDLYVKNKRNKEYKNQNQNDPLIAFTCKSLLVERAICLCGSWKLIVLWGNTSIFVLVEAYLFLDWPSINAFLLVRWERRITSASKLLMPPFLRPTWLPWRRGRERKGKRLQRIRKKVVQRNRKGCEGFLPVVVYKLTLSIAF